MTTHQTNAAPQLNFDSVIRNLIDLIFDETVGISDLKNARQKNQYALLYFKHERIPRLHDEIECFQSKPIRRPQDFHR